MSDPVIAVTVPVTVSIREINAIADLAVQLVPEYKIRDQKADTFRNLTLAADEKINWKKGLIYLIAQYSKGVNFELWMYSTKGGAHLSEFNDQIRPLAIGAVKCEKLGHALKLRLQLQDTMKDEEVETAIKEFMTRIEPTLNEIRGKIKVDVSEKKTKETEAKVVAKVEEKKEEIKKEEIPVLPVDPIRPAIDEDEEVIVCPPTESETKKNRNRSKKSK